MTEYLKLVMMLETSFFKVTCVAPIEHRAIVVSLIVAFVFLSAIVTIGLLLTLSAFCPPKGHIYLDKPAARTCRFI